MFKSTFVFSIIFAMSVNNAYCMLGDPQFISYYDSYDQATMRDQIRHAFTAISKGDIETLKKAIEEGLETVADECLPLTARNDDNETLLAYAIKHKQEPIIKFLLTKGVDVNEKSGNENIPPLIDAIRNAPLTIVNLLLEHKDTDVNTSSNGVTALHLSVAHKKNEFIPLLVAYGANINIQDNEGGTPLDWANYLVRFNPEAFGILQQYGAQTNPEFKLKKIIVRSASSPIQE